MLIPINVHDSWKPFLTDEIVQELNNIEKYIGDDYTPSHDLILRFMTLDLNKIKVIILGQDPYKPEGVANGRAFQPSNLLDWNQTYRQVSLKNMIRAVYACTNNIAEYNLIPDYSTIANEIMFGKFKIKNPVDWFNSLENQGVLFLNTSLTCKIGYSNSHKGIWFEFSHALIKYIANQRKDLNWFLWGKEAAIFQMYIPEGTKYVSRHPMMCSEAYEDDFLRNPCFKSTSNIINWLG